MKNMILGLLAIVLTSTILSGQSTPHDHSRCGFVSNEFQKERIRVNKKYAAEHDLRQETIYIPIKFHRVGSTDGTKQIKVTAILDLMCRIKREFAQYDMVPYIYNGFSDVFNTGIFFDPITNSGQIVSNKDPNAVDIFITDNADTGSVPGDGVTLGYYSPSFGNVERDYIVLRKKEVADSTSTFIHELGHLLSLDHTFVGWEGVQYDANLHGNPLTIVSVGGVDVELVNRNENCETASDQLCDTPADYNFVFSAANTDDDVTNNIATGCNLAVEIKDSKNQILDPDAQNIMSYYSCANQVFSDGQVDLMIADFNSPERAHLRTSYVPNLNEITEVPEFISPSSTSVDTYNSINFEWTPVENADFYVLEISGSTEAFSYITTEPRAFVSNLQPDEFYFYVVAPYNETSSCIRTSSKPLATGDVFTSVQSLTDFADIQIFPNPITQGSNLQVQITSKESFDADIKILGLDGKELVVETGKEIKLNHNILEIPTETISTGMYILQIRSDKGVFSKQIVIK